MLDKVGTQAGMPVSLLLRWQLLWRQQQSSSIAIGSSKYTAGLPSLNSTSASFEQFEQRLLDAVPRLRCLAFALTASRADSDDLVQSTLERALSRQEQCQNSEKVDSWAFSILHSIWKNELRSRWVRRGNGVIDSDHLSHTHQPELSYEQQSIRQAVYNLPEHYRIAVILVDLYGMSYRDAAQMLEVKTGTVMSRLARGRALLISELRPSDTRD